MIIVCCTDLSDRSREGLAAAAALGTRLDSGAELRVVHVLDPAVGALGAAVDAAVVGAARSHLEVEARWLGERCALRIESVLLAGTAAETVLEYAEANQASLVVVASRGYGGSPVWRVGGTADRIARSMRVPILVVREAAPFEVWAADRRPLRVLLGVDWTSSSDAAIRWVKTLRHAGTCDVLVGYVYGSGPVGEGARRYGLERRGSMLEPEPETERLLARDLASRVGVLEGTGKTEFRPWHGLGRVGDDLLDLAESESVDLVVLGTHHKRGVGRLTSITGVALHHGRSALAIVPVPQSEVPIPAEVPSFRRVLVPTDFSPVSSHAIPFAYALFGEGGGEVHLLHVIEDDQDPATDAEVAARLRSLVPRRGAPAGVVTRTEIVRHERAARAICEAAERLGVDVVCMGSHGRSGLRRALVGSVTETVLRESRGAVLVVRSLPPS